MAQWLTNLTSIHEVPSVALLSGLRIRCCPELWCRLQMQLTSCIAVAVALSATTAPIRPLAWEPPYGVGEALNAQKTPPPKKTNKIPRYLYMHVYHSIIDNNQEMQTAS